MKVSDREANTLINIYYIYYINIILIYRRTLVVIFGFWDLQSILGCCLVNLFVPVKFES